MDEIGRNGILGIGAGTDQDDQTGITGHVDGLPAKNRHLDEFSWCVDEVVGIGDHLGFGVMELHVAEALDQGGLPAANTSDECNAFAVAGHIRSG